MIIIMCAVIVEYLYFYEDCTMAISFITSNIKD